VNVPAITIASPRAATPCTASAPGPPSRTSHAISPRASRRATKPSDSPALATTRAPARSEPANAPPTTAPSGSAATLAIVAHAVASSARCQRRDPDAASSATTAAPGSPRTGERADCAR
jgi:hypothetical protein